MLIPRTKEEFIKDILDECGRPISIWVYPTSTSWIDRVKNRMASYGVINPSIPTGSIFDDDYLARCWKENSDAILSARGLSLEDRHALL